MQIRARRFSQRIQLIYTGSVQCGAFINVGSSTTKPICVLIRDAKLPSNLGSTFLQWISATGLRQQIHTDTVLPIAIATDGTLSLDDVISPARILTNAQFPSKSTAISASTDSILAYVSTSGYLLIDLILLILPACTLTWPGRKRSVIFTRSKTVFHFPKFQILEFQTWRKRLNKFIFSPRQNY